MGTPEFSVHSLRAVLELDYDVAAVVTQPDRPRGRGKKTQVSAIKAVAREHGLVVLQPENVNELGVRRQILGLKPDMLVVAAFGQLLCDEYLKEPPLGAVNVHASLLPRHRGAAPEAAAILSGDKDTGISIIRMAKKMDAGAILRVESITIGEKETASQLDVRLGVLGSVVLKAALKDIENGCVRETVQDETLVTFAPKLSKFDGLIDWTSPAHYLSRFVRAMSNWPGAYTSWVSPRRGVMRLVIREGEAAGTESAKRDAEPGMVVSSDECGIVVAAGEGDFRILRLQPAGKRVMSAADFLNGHKIEVGQSFGAF